MSDLTEQLAAFDARLVALEARQEPLVVQVRLEHAAVSRATASDDLVGGAVVVGEPVRTGEEPGSSDRQQRPQPAKCFETEFDN